MTPADTHRPPGAGVTATWNYTLGSIVFLFVVIDAIIAFDSVAEFARTRHPLALALLLLGLLAAATRIRYCWYLRDEDPLTGPPARWTAALLAPPVCSWGLAFVSADLSVYAAVQLWFSGVLYAAVLAGPRRWGVVALALALSAAPLLAHVGRGAISPEQFLQLPHWLVIVYGAMLPLMLFTSLWIWRIVRRLDEARALAAQLAVTQERLRFAADLHDIQGHHLQVIALQAELAERTLGSDAARTSAQLREIRLIAKHAMEETRSLVAGLRHADLADELENAREVLALSGAECALHITSMPEDREARQVLAFAVREATTNILRHSAATRATIALEADRYGCLLAVTNNGAGGTADAREGSGLAGLRDRLAAVGGTLTTARDAATAPDAFALRAWIPAGGPR